MSFLPTTALLWRRCPKLASPTCLARRYLNSGQLPTSTASFQTLGLNKAVVTALQDAFPNVQRPTQMQVKFLKAALRGYDVILKDKTGTGKSFGLLLALLNQPRRYIWVQSSGKYVKRPVITALYLAPHRDLVNQLHYWIKSMYDAILHTATLDSVAQVLLRGASSSIAEQVEKIQAVAPHILLGTPQAVLEAMQLKDSPLSLQHLSTVIVDEADFLIEHMPKVADKYAIAKHHRDLKRRPSSTRQILNGIYQSPHSTDSERERSGPAETRRRPQLIMTSATLKSGFRSAVLGRTTGWFNSMRRPSIVSPERSLAEDETPKELISATLGGGSLVHSALVVSNDGSITNMKGATTMPVAEAVFPAAEAPESASERELSPESEPELSEASSVGPSARLVTDEQEKEFADTPSPFNPSALEAVAVAFAIRVPQVALLVLPASSPVRRAVFELRSLGVNAHALDVMDADGGGAFLLRKESAVADDPTLLVSTLASTRGMDLPNLTHVFILGLTKEFTLEDYVHAAGRAGRFGRSGHVISILEGSRSVTGKNGKPKVANESNRMRQMLVRMGVTPVKMEEFGTVEPEDG